MNEENTTPQQNEENYRCQNDPAGIRDSVKNACSSARKDATQAAEKVVPTLKKFAAAAAFNGIYGAAFTAVFGATLAKELVPDAVKNTVKEAVKKGTVDAQKAADEAVLDPTAVVGGNATNPA